jgi:hypothetical protein
MIAQNVAGKMPSDVNPINNNNNNINTSIIISTRTLIEDHYKKGPDINKSHPSK